MNDLRFPPGDDSNPELVERIRGEIVAQGPMTFARFMELALAAPDLGYYALGEARAGRSGDFLTAPETHPIFGVVVATQVAECWRLMGQPDDFAVREYGAGRGTLAGHVLDALQTREEPLYASLTYEIADLSEGAVDAALPGLGESGHGATVAKAGGGRFRGVALANELLDALPFHRLVQHGGEPREIFVTVRDGWFADEIGPLSGQARGALPPDLALVEEQRIEVSPATREWVRSLAAELEAGFGLVLDYGYPRPDIHDSERFPRGTLKTYRRHEVGDDPYRSIGRQDITAHVDFTAVADAAADCGLRVLGLTTQSEFVAGLGIDRLLLDIQARAGSPAEYVEARSAVMALLDPSGLGRFRVLAVGTDVDADAPLSGFSFRLPRR